MQQESDFKPDPAPGSHIGKHQPPQRHNPKRKGIYPGVLIAAGVLLVGGGFAAGVQYQKGRPPVAAQAGNMAGQYGQFGGGMMRQRAGALGTVTAVSSSSITITERSFGPDSNSNGSSKTYTIDSSTKITNDGAMATTSDIQTGDTVLIRTASSTSTTATRILINPTMDNPGTSTQSQDNTSGSSTNASSI